MSLWQPFGVRCLDCEASYDIELMDALNASRHPMLRDAILEQSLHRPRCPHCGLQVAVEFETVYTDFGRGHYVGVCVGNGSTWRTDLERHRAAFDQSFTLGPEIANEIGWGLMTRMVYGLGALREKLIIWDAGLDDYIIEAVKGDLIGSLNLDISEVQLRLTAALENERLVFAKLTPAEPFEGRPVRRLSELQEHVGVPMQAYWKRQQYRHTVPGDYPWLGKEWLVDVHLTRPAGDPSGR